MSNLKQCRTCGADIAGNAPFGHCPKCLLDIGFGPLPDELDSPNEGDNARRFGDYELIEQLGRGGMGVVYKARQVRLNRLVALKMISAGEFASPTLIQRFHREAESAANLHHPNIVPIYETGEKRGQHYISMGLIDGVTLDAHVRRLRPGDGASGRDARVALRTRHEAIALLLAKVARAVDHAHQHGVLHRDLKPGNIIVDQEGEPHLTDFGVAKVLGRADSGLTASGAIVGTPSYMAPEQAAGQSRHITVAADIYSLGAVLYSLLTGRPPFRGSTPVETLRQVVEEEPKHPSTLTEGMDVDLATIAMKCLEKDPQRRYPGASALADDLERWARREPIQARRIHKAERVWRWCRRNPKVAILGGSVAGLLAAMAVLSTVVAIRITAKNEDIKKTAEEKRKALEALQSDLVSRLDLMWETSNQKFVPIKAAARRALWGDAPQNPSGNASRLTLTFGVYTHETPAKMLSNMSPVLGRLEQSMTHRMSRPVDIDLRIYRHYEDAKVALVGGTLDFVRFGSASYVEAKTLDPRVSLLLAQNGRIRGYIFTRASSAIHDISDVKGKSFAWVDDSSTTGYYLPARFMSLKGISATDLLNRGTNFLGAHDKVVAAVAEGGYDVGACNASIVDKFTKEQGIEFRVLTEIRETKGLPWVASPTLTPEIASEIRAGLRSITEPSILEPLKNETTGFEEARDEDYDTIRDAMNGAQYFFGRPPIRPFMP